LETRVKAAKADKVREQLKLRGCFLDNYHAHPNGRIWVVWDDKSIDVRHVKSTSQMIHCGVYDVNGDFQTWMTAIYAHNQPAQRKILWKELDAVHRNQQGPWFLIGDFNNVIKSMDRIGGNLVTEHEFADLNDMMNTTGLFEKESIGDYYTWTNKHTVGTIYSRIDHVLGNLDWLQANLHRQLEILAPNVSDHSLLCLRTHEPKAVRNVNFKFTNSVIQIAGYHDIVNKSWSTPLMGRPMAVLWFKLMRLQAPLHKLSKQLSNVAQTIVKVRNDLLQAQNDLTTDRMNSSLIERVKGCTDRLLYWHDLETQMLRQQTKIDWLREGDSNSAYFHVALKVKHATSTLHTLFKDDGTPIQGQDDIAQEVCDFYRQLMGTRIPSLRKIDITAMREGPQLSMAQRDALIAPVTISEIKNALKGIGDLKSPGIDGYGARFFKASWDTIANDLIAAVHEFFNKNVLYRAFNETVVTLIPKHPATKTVKEFRPIAGCSTFYKIISKILTDRLGRVLSSIISPSQAAFVPGQKIHNHILLAFELLKGYNRKDGTPRCMIQLDLQKAYDMVDWSALKDILQEVSIPNTFISWIMTTVTTVSYRFNINGKYTDRMEAQRGIRQGDPLSPLLFVITMEYLNRLLLKM
jgi:hypothetical protein